MSLEATIVLVVGSLALALVGTLSAMAGQFVERRRWERRLLDLSGALRRDMPGPDAARMQRLEEAVDAIAVELERVGEGQRFVTKLLADRNNQRTPRTPQPGAVGTSPPPTA